MGKSVYICSRSTAADCIRNWQDPAALGVVAVGLCSNRNRYRNKD